jgi:hypothetical protein
MFAEVYRHLTNAGELLIVDSLYMYLHFALIRSNPPNLAQS